MSGQHDFKIFRKSSVWYAGFEGGRQIPLRGITKQINTFHIPYHLKRTKKYYRYEVRKFKTCTTRSKFDSMTALRKGVSFDKNLERLLLRNATMKRDAVCVLSETENNHADDDGSSGEQEALSYLRDQGVDVFAWKVRATNADENGDVASFCEIDLVGRDTVENRLLVCELKYTGKQINALQLENKSAPVNRLTKFRRSFLDKTRIQAILCALFLGHTWKVDNVSPSILICSSYGQKYFEKIVTPYSPSNFPWIKGYRAPFSSERPLISDQHK